MSEPLRTMNVADIIKSAWEGKPADAADAFNDAIAAKMQAAIDARREEIAQSMFDDSSSDEVESDDIEMEADAEVDEVEAEEPELETEPEELEVDQGEEPDEDV